MRVVSLAEIATQVFRQARQERCREFDDAEHHKPQQYQHGSERFARQDDDGDGHLR